MCGNRVEELESRVKELEASVEGLTDELVECKVRLREMENLVDGDVAADVDGDSTAEQADTPNTEETQSGTNREDEEADADGDEIIVA